MRLQLGRILRVELHLSVTENGAYRDWCKRCECYVLPSEYHRLCKICNECIKKIYAKEHESLQFNEENLRSEKREGSLLRNSGQGESKRAGGKEESKKEMRKLTQLVKKDPGNVVGEWRDSKADISFDDIYAEFEKRSVSTMGISMPLEQFKNMFEVVRYQEILSN
jgi:hypothetical protein